MQITRNHATAEGEGREREAILTCTAVYVVEVTRAVLVRPVTCLAVEARHSRPAISSCLNNHSLVEVLVELQRALASFHELCRFREVFLASPPWFLSWM